MDRRTAARLALGALLLLALAAAVFSEAAGFGFVAFDDEDYVTRNPRVLAGLTADGAAWALRTTTMGSWHPLTWLSLMLDVELFGPDPRWMHRTSLLLHAASGVALLALLHAATGAYVRSLLVAALFLVHPLHVESAVWVSERKDVLSALLWFLGAFAYVRHARRPGAARLAPVVLFFLLALAAKPMAVTFPLTLLLLDFWPLGRLRAGLARPLLEKLPLLAVSAAAALFTAWSQRAAGAVDAIAPIPLWARLVNAASSVGWYCAKTLWPTHLAFFYPHPGTTAPVAPALAVAAAVAAATGWLLLRRRSRPGWLAGWLWFLLTLVPVIGLVQAGAQARADRYTYVPLVGVFVAAAWALPARRGRGGRAAAAGLLAAAGVAALGGAARAQAAHWRDTRSLAEHAERVAPSWMTAQHLGIVAQLDGRPDDALALMRRAFERGPSNPQVYYNLAWVHERRGEFGEALSWYRRAAEAMPADAESRTSAGALLSALSRDREAVPLLEEATALAPDSPRAWAALGAALLRAGDPGRAEQALRTALRIDPADDAARVNLGRTFAVRRRTAEAAEQFREVLRRSPGDRQARAALRWLGEGP